MKHVFLRMLIIPVFLFTAAISYSVDVSAGAVPLIDAEESNDALNWVHGFYAFGSFGQRDMIPQMDSVSFGWSVMQWSEESGIRLNTSPSGGNQMRVPDGYALIAALPRENDTRANLNVFMDTSTGLGELLASKENRSASVKEILTELSRTYSGIGRSPYDGVTINFEGLRGKESQADFTAFLVELRAGLSDFHTLYVTVHPATTDGKYFDGYNYREIGRLADKVILLAHDYHPRSMEGFLGTAWQRNAALTPIAEIHHALEAITCPETGVEDLEKIAIAFSFPNVGWFVDKQGLLVSPTPITVSNETVMQRMAQPDTYFGWSETHKNPYIIYTTEKDEYVFLWYEDSRSVAEKIKLARSFGVTGASVWRLGIIPNNNEWDVWGNFARKD